MYIYIKDEDNGGVVWISIRSVQVKTGTTSGIILGSNPDHTRKYTKALTGKHKHKPSRLMLHN